MPGGNRTGPMGQGPMTGRGAGYCAGHSASGFVNPPPSMGADRGRGGGGRRGGCGGWRHRHRYYATGLPGWQRFGTWGLPPEPAFPPTPSREQELAALRQQAAGLVQMLGELRTRIQGLEKPAADTRSPMPEEQR